MKHILVVRKKPDTHDFMRHDYYDGSWMQYNDTGQVLHAMLPSIKDEMTASNGNTALTFSSCRSGLEFVNPDNAGIEDGITTILLIPLEDATGDAVHDNMRLWAVITWMGPENVPVKGTKIRQRSLTEWLDNFFSVEQLEQWKVPPHGGRTEVWFRPSWNAIRMFPELFPEMAKKVNDVKELPKPEYKKPPEKSKEKDVIIVPVVDGKPLVRPSFRKATKWSFYNIDGTVEKSGFATREAAEIAMDKYLRANNMRLPEMIKQE
jgi:hypothetical protein